MSEHLTRRSVVTGLALAPLAGFAQTSSQGPTEAQYERGAVPGFVPKWSKPQLNRLMIQDFVIFAHSDLDQVKKMLDAEPNLVNAFMDWGGGDGSLRSAEQAIWAGGTSSKCCSNAARGWTSSARR